MNPGTFFTETKQWEYSIAFRADDPGREGFKQIVCGGCLKENESNDDPRTIRGAAKCERCGRCFGDEAVHASTMAKLVDIPA